MKILFITTQFPYPLDNGGKIGAYNGLSVLSEGKNKITVLSFSEEPDTIEEGIDFYKKKFHNISFEKPVLHDVHIRKKPIKLAKAMFRNYLFDQPYISAKFYDRKMFMEIDRLFSKQRWDMVFIDYLNMAIYGEYIQKKYKNRYSMFVLKDHNIEYEIIKQEASHSKGLKKIILNIEWKRTQKFEERNVRSADYVFSVCDENTEILKKINSNSFSMLPAFEMLDVRRTYPNENNVLYMGNLSWEANYKGLSWFINDVLPIVKDQIKDVKLIVVGSGPAENEFKNNSSVDYRGYLKDISGIYDNIKVFVVPLFEGSGIRIKILEAFNNEVPVVSTSLGCATIGAKDQYELFIENESKNFANAVVRLLIDRDLNIKTRIKAKEFLRDRFSLDSRCNEFDKIIHNNKKKRGQTYA